jgi:hypothetical protein
LDFSSAFPQRTFGWSYAGFLFRSAAQAEYALGLYQNLMSLFITLYTEDLPELPPEELKRKIAADTLLAQETLQGLSRRGDILVALARRLEEYIPSGKIVV